MPPYGEMQLCRNRAGYEVEPRDDLDLDMDEVEERLVAQGVETLTNVGMLLVARVDLGEPAPVVEVSVFESGKLMMKTTEEEAARAAMERVRGALGLDG